MNDNQIVEILEEWMEDALQNGDYERYKKLSVDWMLVYVSSRVKLP